LIVRDEDDQGSRYALYVIDMQGKVMGKLLSGFVFLDSAISPDNQWLVFSEFTSDYTNTIHVYNLKEKTDGILATNCSYPSASSWSPDGNSFVVSCHHLLVFSKINGKWSKQGEVDIPDKLRKLPPGIVEAISLYSPAWSPDEELIAFQPSIGKIFILNTKNGQIQKIYKGKEEFVDLNGWINIASP
jgi:Tol biopolymer transport system component